MKFLLIILAMILVQTLSAAQLNVDSGNVRTMDVSVDCSPCLFEASIKILKLNDTDPKWASSTGLVFHGSGKERATIGFLKLDGEQGLSSFINSFDKHGDMTTSSTIKSNLSFDEEYKIEAYWNENSEISFEVTGEKSSFDIGFKPLKAEYMVSGMHLEFSSK